MYVSFYSCLGLRKYMCHIILEGYSFKRFFLRLQLQGLIVDMFVSQTLGV